MIKGGQFINFLEQAKEKKWRAKNFDTLPTFHIVSSLSSQKHKTIVANVYGATKYLVDYGKVLFEYSHRIQEQESCILKMKCICKCNLYLGAEDYWILTAIPVIPYLFRLNLNWSLNTSAFIEMIVPDQKVIIIPYVTSKLNFFFL